MPWLLVSRGGYCTKDLGLDLGDLLWIISSTSFPCDKKFQGAEKNGLWWDRTWPYIPQRPWLENQLSTRVIPVSSYIIFAGTRSLVRFRNPAKIWKFTYPWSIFPTNDEVKRFRFPIPSTITLSLPDPHLFASPWSMVNSRPPLFSEIALWSTESNIASCILYTVYRYALLGTNMPPFQAILSLWWFSFFPWNISQCPGGGGKEKKKEFPRGTTDQPHRWLV